MFGIFKKKRRPVVMLGVEVGDVQVGTNSDEIMTVLETVIHVLQRRIDVLNQQADARFKDTQALFKLVRIKEPPSATILITESEAQAMMRSGTAAKSKVKKVVKSPAPKKTAKKKAKK